MNITYQEKDINMTDKKFLEYCARTYGFKEETHLKMCKGDVFKQLNQFNRCKDKGWVKHRFEHKSDNYKLIYRITDRGREYLKSIS